MLSEKRLILGSLIKWLEKYQMSMLAVSAVLIAGCAESAPEIGPTHRTVLVTQVSDASTLVERFSGIIEASDRARLSFEIGGRIQAIQAHLGDEVQKGQLLAKLDDEDLRLSVSDQTANLANATAELRDAKRDFDRRAALSVSGATSQSEADQAQSRYERAKSQVRGAEAKLAQAEQRLSKARLTAPFSGEITRREAEPAEVVASGQPILHLIRENSALEVRTYVTPNLRNALARGDTARVSKLTGKQAFIAPIIELGSQATGAGLFPITLGLVQGEPTFRPGETVEVSWTTPRPSGAVLIPVSALSTLSDEKATVFVLDYEDDNEKVIAREVSLGQLQSEHAVVLSGIKAGEWVVSKGAKLLEHGETVHPVGIGPARYHF